MKGEKGFVVILAAAAVGLYYYAQKHSMTFSAAAASILGETPQPNAGQAQFANGNQTGPQNTTLENWYGTFNDVPLYQDNNVNRNQTV